MSLSNAAISPFGVKTIGPTVHDLPSAALSFLRRHGVEHVWHEGEEVQRYRQALAHASWLVEGRLRTLMMQSDGSVQGIGWVMPDELFGIGNVLTSAPSPVTLVVDTPQARTIQFDLDTVRRLYAEVPGAGFGISIGLSRRLMQMFDLIDAGGPRSLPDRLRAVLGLWAKHYGIAARDGSVELWISQTQLAEDVGASRQRVHMELQQLRDSGEIELGYRKVILRPAFFKHTEMLPPPR